MSAMFSKRHYEKLAETIVIAAGNATFHDKQDGAALRRFAVTLANVFEDDNPRFDRDRFLAACYIVEE